MTDITASVQTTSGTAGIQSSLPGFTPQRAERGGIPEHDSRHVLPQGRTGFPCEGCR